ncbi:RNA-splicing ligase RtcB [Enhygromyxa salina]|uniref:3'-phosphate/5'-hydroxy nucleic acid ligase n=1 Tax=Enhygromyxa salina TaxID=215803 RepID=A0A2S9YDK1_9BACT|nr:RtcB family protein [Enhygromyxa salina]PRQ03175.1 RNA-splicing ligase RtcB [Enhygromyxa salina]
MTTTNYEVDNLEGAVPIKRWTKGVPVEDAALRQLANTARLPFIHKWVAAMPDVHWGMGATVGSVIPTKGAIVPAAVGVDLGCGMMAVETSLRAEELPDTLGPVRAAIERAVPHGRSNGGRRRDRGAWGDVPGRVGARWTSELAARFSVITDKHPKIASSNNIVHLGTLGTGNHFIELCLDERDHVWVMLHSGSRGVGNRIGSYFIRLAREEMQRWFINLPDQNLAYFPEGTEHFDDYVEAVGWAQDFARINRELMMAAALRALEDAPGMRPFTTDAMAVNCHHNYVARERHFGAKVWVTRKGAVRAGEGELGIIPGSMGAKSFIVRGKGNADSFCSCSHGAGRAMSRTEARKRFTVQDHAEATKHVECRKDEGVIDETPAAYKPIEAVMAAQADLVEVAHVLRQVVCVKG